MSGFMSRNFPRSSHGVRARLYFATSRGHSGVDPIQPMPATRSDLNEDLTVDDAAVAHQVRQSVGRADDGGRLARNGRFIDGRDSFQDRAIGRDYLTGLDKKSIGLSKVGWSDRFQVE